jgi:predicted HTH transcriptional regulator
LVDTKADENKTLEFKELLPGEKYDDRKKFLADAASFANADGGYLIYGIRDTDGVASELVGLEGNQDQTILRQESILRTGVQPRLSSYKIVSMQVAEQKFALLIRIEKGWYLPHESLFRGTTSSTLGSQRKI